MKKHIKIGEGRPKGSAYRSKYRHIYDDIRPGIYLEFAHAAELHRFASAVHQYAKRNGLAWRVVRRTNEGRVYIVAADGDKPTDRSV